MPGPMGNGVFSTSQTRILLLISIQVSKRRLCARHKGSRSRDSHGRRTRSSQRPQADTPSASRRCQSCVPPEFLTDTYVKLWASTNQRDSFVSNVWKATCIIREHKEIDMKFVHRTTISKIGRAH